MKIFMVLMMVVCSSHVYGLHVQDSVELGEDEPTTITMPAQYKSRFAKRPEFIGKQYGDLIDNLRTRLYHTDEHDPDALSQINRLRKNARHIEHDLLRQALSANHTFRIANEDYIRMATALNETLAVESAWLTHAQNTTRHNAMEIVNITGFLSQLPPKITSQTKLKAKWDAQLLEAQHRREITHKRYLKRATHTRDTISGVNHIIGQLGETMSGRNVHYNLSLTHTLDKHYSSQTRTAAERELEDERHGKHLPDHLDGLRQLMSRLHRQLHDMLRMITNTELLTATRQNNEINRVVLQRDAAQKLLTSYEMATVQGKEDITRLKKETTAIHAVYAKHVNTAAKAKKKLVQITKTHKPLLTMHLRRNAQRQKQLTLVAQLLSIINDRSKGQHWHAHKH